MLVLTFNPEESVLIGPDITVEVIRVGANKVRLGITAPSTHKINRRPKPKPRDKERIP